MHFRFRHCHNLEFQFVVSLLFARGEKPTFKTTAGWCVAHLKGFAYKECRELTLRERNIDFANGVAMATAKKVTKLLIICRQCDLNLPQRVPTTLEGKNSKVWDKVCPPSALWSLPLPQMNPLKRKSPHLLVIVLFPPLTSPLPPRHYFLRHPLRNRNLRNHLWHES